MRISDWSSDLCSSDLINENTKQVDGGEFNYELGIFQEKALNLITDKIPKPTVTEIKATLIKALTYANSKGLTSIQSDDLSHAGSFKDVLQAYHELHSTAYHRLGKKYLVQ